MLNMDERPDAIVFAAADDEPDIDEDNSVAAKTIKAEPISAKSKPSLLETLERNAEKSRAMFDGGNGKRKREELLV